MSENLDLFGVENISSQTSLNYWSLSIRFQSYMVSNRVRLFLTISEDFLPFPLYSKYFQIAQLMTLNLEIEQKCPWTEEGHHPVT